MTASSVSAFAMALSAMTADERARAQRLRDALNLRDDDALWAYCGIIKGFETILQEIPAKCAQAAEQAMRQAELSPNDDARVEAQRMSDSDPHRTLQVIMLGSLYVTFTIIFGCTAFALGTILLNGHAPWIAGDEAPQGAFLYAVTAILKAPVGGMFALVGLLNLGFLAAARHCIQARRRHAAR